MKFGISVSQIHEVDLVIQAESVGYDFCWVWDSPMIRSNLWALLALVADRTTTIAVGPGVAIPSLAMAPVTANAIATINAIAPGRTFLGVGTGNTALRAMGQVPMGIADFKEHLKVIRGLISGESVIYEKNGISEEIAFQSLELNSINLDDPIPIHVSGFGPKAQALAGEYGDALITGIPRGGSISGALENSNIGATRADRPMDKFEIYALVNLMLLRRGETLGSPRVLEEVRSFTEAHHSHYGHLDSAETRFLTPEIIRNFCIAGTPDQVIEQLAGLESEGLTGINFIAPVERQYSMCHEFADAVISRMK
ncbi:MAG: LLM class flavin-dependent oxidoreductase [SAR202 cluster bacterium]|nr:MAG: LLM class flavin-dependent oxidoreductase [SAR202 cluster bacterium]